MFPSTSQSRQLPSNQSFWKIKVRFFFMEERILLQQTKMKKIILYKNGRKFSSDPSLFIISKIKKAYKNRESGNYDSNIFFWDGTRESFEDNMQMLREERHAGRTILTIIENNRPINNIPHLLQNFAVLL